MISMQEVEVKTKLVEDIRVIWNREKNTQLNKIITKLQQDSDRFKDLGQGEYTQGYCEAIRTAIGIINESLTG